MRILFGVLFCIMVLACAYSPQITYYPQWEIKGAEDLIIYNKEIKKALNKAPHKDLYRLEKDAHKRAQELYSEAQKKFGISGRPFMGIEWNVFAIRGGEALCIDRKIRLNEIMFLYNYDNYMKVIIPHEIAHLIAWQLDNTWEYDAHSHPKYKEVMNYFLGYVHIVHHMDAYPGCELDYKLRKSRFSQCNNCSDIEIPTCKEILE